MPVLDAAVAPVRLPSEEELAEYDDEWVAVYDGKVVGHGRTPQTALNRAAANGVSEPEAIFHVPLKPEGRAYY